MPNPDQTPIEAFLAPLAALAADHPEIEGLVIWAQDGVWPPSSAQVEALESEEIVFYAEGLLAEGFGLTWDVLSLAETPEEPEAIRLMVWEGPTPPAPPPPAPWRVLDRRDWNPA